MGMTTTKTCLLYDLWEKPKKKKKDGKVLDALSDKADVDIGWLRDMLCDVTEIARIYWTHPVKSEK